jgi:hypothetical protein
MPDRHIRERESVMSAKEILDVLPAAIPFLVILLFVAFGTGRILNR